MALVVSHLQRGKKCAEKAGEFITVLLLLMLTAADLVL